MLSVTDTAVEALAKTLEANDAGEEQGLRLARTPQGEFGLALDEQREGDQVIASDERPILFVDQEISAALDGATLDVSDSPEGKRLTLRMSE